MRVSKNIDGLIFNSLAFPEIKIANKEANEFMVKDPRYDILGSTGEGLDFQCVQKSCTKMPQTVCKECIGYVCEDHLFRHPDCSEGR